MALILEKIITHLVLGLYDLVAATFLVRSTGRSMRGVGIFEGDILVVDRSISPVDGSVIVAAVNGEYLVKNLQGKYRPLQVHSRCYRTKICPISNYPQNNLKMNGNWPGTGLFLPKLAV